MNITVIILTFNEQENIKQCLDSVYGWANEIIVVDSGSTDETLSLIKHFDVELYYNKFINFSDQRNFAISKVNVSSDNWVLFLDADEYLTLSIKDEIKLAIQSDVYTNYFLNRKFIWMGNWVKRGYYPCNLIRLFKSGHAVCESRSVNEHLIVKGTTGYIKNPFYHQCNKKLTHWIIKHINRAELEADELINKRNDLIKSKLFSNIVERKRWIRNNIWENLPIFVRPFLYFLYRFLLKGGLFDGRTAFTYHFLQSLWFPMMIDIFYFKKKYLIKK